MPNLLIPRNAASKLKHLAKKFPAVAVIGPRQSGKSTLIKSLFPKHEYISFENTDVIRRAEKDPRKFLDAFEKGAILDEVQRVPQLFNYLQGVIDEHDKPGHFILSGSMNFLLHEKITQSLAGRIAFVQLLPFSMNELMGAKQLPAKIDKTIFQGFYPRIYSSKISPIDFYPNYLLSYVERDVRLIKNLANLGMFQKFMHLIAGRIGQLLNVNSLANETGMDNKTINSWLTILEASYITFTLKPYHKNFNKRAVKTAKVYFYDTGLACSLLHIESEKALAGHYLRGGLFENLVISEILKSRFNRGLRSNLYFWRDNTGNEMDCVIDNGDHLIPIEIKSSSTFSQQFLKNSRTWDALMKKNKQKVKDSYVIYGGNSSFDYEGVSVIDWRNIPEF